MGERWVAVHLRMRLCDLGRRPMEIDDVLLHFG